MLRCGLDTWNISHEQLHRSRVVNGCAHMQRFTAPRGSGYSRDESSECCNARGNLLDGCGRMLREQHQVIRLGVPTRESRAKNFHVHGGGVRGVGGVVPQTPRSFAQRLAYRCSGFSR